MNSDKNFYNSPMSDRLLAAAAGGSSRNSVVLHGPAGCGKTTNAAAIRDRLGLAFVLDGWCPGQPFPPKGALVVLDGLHIDDATLLAPYLADHSAIEYPAAMQMLAKS